MQSSLLTETAENFAGKQNRFARLIYYTTMRTEQHAKCTRSIPILFITPGQTVADATWILCAIDYFSGARALSK